jgi:hypothetical protein
MLCVTILLDTCFSRWFLAYSSTLKMEAVCSNVGWLSADYTAYIPDESTLHNHRCENLKSYIMFEPIHLRCTCMVQTSPRFPAANFRGNEDRNADNVCPSTRFGLIPSGQRTRRYHAWYECRMLMGEEKIYFSSNRLSKRSNNLFQVVK